MLTDWYRAWRNDRKLGDHKFLPQSDGQGQKLASEVHAVLKAQIAVYFGKPDGGLTTLQNGVQKLARNEKIECEQCRRDIWKEGHQENCEIYTQYMEVMS